MPIVKAETNIPLVARIKYCDFAEGKYGPQVKLKGTMETADVNGVAVTGDLVFLPLDITNKLAELGIVKQKGSTEPPEFMVLNPNAAVVITRRKQGYDVALKNGQPPVAISSPAPAGGPAATPANGSGERGPWAEMLESYRQCAAIAQKVWGPDFDRQAIVAATATLFIESNKRGLHPVSSAKQKAAEIRDALDDEPPPPEEPW